MSESLVIVGNRLAAGPTMIGVVRI